MSNSICHIIPLRVIQNQNTNVKFSIFDVGRMRRLRQTYIFYGTLKLIFFSRCLKLVLLAVVSSWYNLWWQSSLKEENVVNININYHTIVSLFYVHFHLNYTGILLQNMLYYCWKLWLQLSFVSQCIIMLFRTCHWVSTTLCRGFCKKKRCIHSWIHL